MIANALDNRPEHIGFTCVDVDVKEHSRGIRILKRTAVTVKPRSENNSVCACRNRVDNLCHIVVKAGVRFFCTVCYLLLFNENSYLIKTKMILDPFEAFACRFHLGKIVKAVRISTDNCGNHRRGIDKLFFYDCTDPARCSRINVSIADRAAACADTDERSVTAAAEYGCSRQKTELLRRLFGNSADHVGRFDYIRQMIHVYIKNIGNGLAPALFALSCIIKESCKRRILCHREFIRTTADKKILNIKPLVRFFVVLRLMIFDPLIFVNRGFNAA